MVETLQVLVGRLREDARGGHAYHELSDEAADEIELILGDGVGSLKRAYADGYAAAKLEIEQLQADKMVISQTASYYLHQITRLRTTLEMGVQLAESGGHDGKVESCPTCHFVCEAQNTLATHVESCYDAGVASSCDRATPSSH